MAVDTANLPKVGSDERLIAEFMQKSEKLFELKTVIHGREALL